MAARHDNWGTPLWLFARLEREFGPFDLDAAAEPWSALVTHFLTAEDDALSGGPWLGDRVWLNPPYARSLLEAFLRRAIEHAGEPEGLVVCLLPVYTETGWWHDLVLPHATEVRFIRGRVAFRPPPEREGRSRPRHASMVVVFDGSPGPPRMTSMTAPRNSSQLLCGQMELAGKRARRST